MSRGMKRKGLHAREVQYRSLRRKENLVTARLGRNRHLNGSLRRIHWRQFRDRNRNRLVTFVVLPRVGSIGFGMPDQFKHFDGALPSNATLKLLKHWLGSKMTHVATFFLLDNLLQAFLGQERRCAQP